MFIFRIHDDAEKPMAHVIENATAEKISITLEKGESIVLNTPVGNLNIERTQDTFSITCWDGYGCFTAEIHEDSGLWRREHPLSTEESEQRRVDFIKDEMECQENIGSPIGVLVGRKFVCTDCRSQNKIFAGSEPVTPVYRCNIGFYSQSCSACGKLVVEGKTTNMPNLF